MIDQILFHRFDASKLIVRILEHDWNLTNESKTQDFKVEKTIKHSGYSTVNYDNDIGLIKLKEPIKFQGPMRPACLPEQGNFYKRSWFCQKIIYIIFLNMSNI